MGTISEATGRSASFLQSASMAMVALGFIAPATRFSPTFYAFALPLLGALLVLGLATFLRCAQLGVEDSLLAMRADGIVRFYLDTAPTLADHIAAPTARDAGEAATPVRLPLQTLLTNAALIAFVEGALLGTSAALGARAGGVSLLAALVAGVAAGLATVGMLLVVQRRLWRAND